MLMPKSTPNHWAWMANPSTIVKVLSITFANRMDDARPSLPEVSSCLSDKWKRGLTYRVIVRLNYIKDHTPVPLDDFVTTPDTVPYELITTSLSRSLRAIDGTHESKKGDKTCVTSPPRE